MTNKHTPGPWEARDYQIDGRHGNAQPGSIWVDCRAYDQKGRPLGGTVAEVYKNGTGNAADPAVQEANAKLIASAPDLLLMNWLQCRGWRVRRILDDMTEGWAWTPPGSPTRVEDVTAIGPWSNGPLLPDELRKMAQQQFDDEGW